MPRAPSSLPRWTRAGCVQQLVLAEISVSCPAPIFGCKLRAANDVAGIPTSVLLLQVYLMLSSAAG